MGGYWPFEYMGNVHNVFTLTAQSTHSHALSFYPSALCFRTFDCLLPVPSFRSNKHLIAPHNALKCLALTCDRIAIDEVFPFILFTTSFYTFSSPPHLLPLPPPITSRKVKVVHFNFVK